MRFHYFEPISKFAKKISNDSNYCTYCTLSRNFSLDEAVSSFDVLKPGKAEFIKNFGAQTKEWIISFMNDIVSTSKIPNLFKRSNGQK
jgi:hypothetical protein